jgi:hypothetical protein
MSKDKKGQGNHNVSLFQIASFMKLSDEEKLEVALGFIEFARAGQKNQDYSASLRLKRI